MKKVLLSIYTNLSAFFAYLFAAPAAALASHGPAHTPVPVSPFPTGQFDDLGKIGAGDFGAIVGSAITILFVVAIVIALGFLVYGGIKWITSGGDKTAVEAARNTIVAAVVGLVVVFLSYFILNLVLGFFNLSLGKLELPTLGIPNR